MADSDTQALQGRIATLDNEVQNLTYRMNTHKHTGGDLTQPVDSTELPVKLYDAATILVDAGAGSHFYVTLGGNRTLGNPTSPKDGQKITFEIIQDGTGNRTLAYGGKFAFGTTLGSITLTTTANKRDFIGVIYRQSTDKFYVVAFADGY